MKKFCDLLWTIGTIQEYENNYQCQLTRSHLVRIIQNSFLGGRRTKSAQPLLNLLIDLQLLDFNEQNQVFVKPRGKKLAKKGSLGAYDLNEEQKKILTPWYITSASGIFKEWINYFSLKESGTLHATRSQIITSLQQWTEEMLYLGVATQYNDELKLSGGYAWVASYSEDKRAMTLEELKGILNRQVIAGRKAEEFVVNFEKNRLMAEGFFTEAKSVERISEQLVNAGYDILSFSGPSLEPNRFIEVKSVSENLEFYLSRNELETAKVLGSQYFLYLVNQKNISKITLDIIDNPYYFITENCTLEPIQYKVLFNKGLEKRGEN